MMVDERETAFYVGDTLGEIQVFLFSSFVLLSSLELNSFLFFFFITSLEWSDTLLLSLLLLYYPRAYS